MLENIIWCQRQKSSKDAWPYWEPRISARGAVRSGPKEENTLEELKTMDHKKHPGLMSRWGFILSAVGSAVGMANVWGFPAKMGAYGGGAFLVAYLIFVALRPISFACGYIASSL